MLDTLARKSLWEVGLNYMHKTGHGVGAYLTVHEGILILKDLSELKWLKQLIKLNCLSFLYFFFLNNTSTGRRNVYCET